MIMDHRSSVWSMRAIAIIRIGALFELSEATCASLLFDLNTLLLLPLLSVGLRPAFL